MWPERGLNHSGEKPNELRVNSPIHQATWVGGGGGGGALIEYYNRKTRKQKKKTQKS